MQDYWRLMCQVWADGEDFILIEHDIEFDQGHIDELIECDHEWCTTGDWWRLTRFRAELMRKVPDALSRLPVPYRHWIPLEWEFNGLMKADGYADHHHMAAIMRVANLIQHNLGNSDARAPVWAEWLRGLPDDVPDFELGTSSGERMSWRYWAWVACPNVGATAGAPGRPDWPCDRYNCRRRIADRNATNRCQPCAELEYSPTPPYRPIGFNRRYVPSGTVRVEESVKRHMVDQTISDYTDDGWVLVSRSRAFAPYPSPPETLTFRKT